MKHYFHIFNAIVREKDNIFETYLFMAKSYMLAFSKKYIQT